MKRFVEGEDRNQVTLLSECLDDYVGEDNPVRALAHCGNFAAKSPHSGAQACSDPRGKFNDHEVTHGTIQRRGGEPQSRCASRAITQQSLI